MAVETATYLSQLDITKPTAFDPKSEGDDHIRLLKSTIKATFPNFTAAALSATQAQLDKLVTSDAVNASAPENSIAVSSSGKVGVLNPSPTYELDVAGTISNQTANGTETAIRMFQSGISNWKFSIPAGVPALVVTDTGSGRECIRMDANGNVISSTSATPPLLATNGQLVFNLTSNTNLRVSVRGSDGVTRTANITLA
jgi:hypothetical protein